MSEWFPAPAITKLNQEIQANWPDRDTASDGVLGDASHQAKKSDHNPAWDEPEPFTGIVRATDRDDDGWPALDVQAFILDRCRSGAERRLAYLIHNRKIYSATYGWVERDYTGDNPHESHIHFSLAHDMTNFDDSPWLAGFDVDDEPEDKPKEPEEMKPYLVKSGGGVWVVAVDLTSKVKVGGQEDWDELIRSRQYLDAEFSDLLMSRIPEAAGA